MRPPDLNDPEMAAFLGAASQRIAVMMRARGAELPPAAIDRFARVADEHLVAHPRDRTFFNIAGSRLVEIAHAVERELPGGTSDPQFGELVARRLREVLESQGESPGDPGASA